LRAALRSALLNKIPVSTEETTNLKSIFCNKEIAYLLIDGLNDSCASAYVLHTTKLNINEG
jgi:hypothetical protein